MGAESDRVTVSPTPQTHSEDPHRTGPGRGRDDGWRNVAAVAEYLTIAIGRWTLRQLGFAVTGLGVWYNTRSGTTRILTWAELGGAR